MIRRSAPAVLALCLLTAPFPAMAEDATATGIIAGLGVSAASGSTTLGDGAGAIEAGLLGSEGFRMAGTIVRSAADAKAQGKRILLLARDQQPDLLGVETMRRRMESLSRLVRTSCAIKSSAPSQYRISGSSLGEATPADLVAVAKVDTSIAAIALTAEDRRIIDAIVMGDDLAIGGSSGAWIPWREGAAAPGVVYVVPGEPVSLSGSSPLWAAYQALQSAAEQVGCSSPEGKAAVEMANGYINGINAADKGPSPLASALQIDAVIRSPYLLLRVVIEQVGGTSITRSGVLYTFGWPNAAMVSSGLLVSFRLIDPAAGGVPVMTGLVRCAVRPTNLKKAADVLAHPHWEPSVTQPYPPGSTLCDYRIR